MALFELPSEELLLDELALDASATAELWRTRLRAVLVAGVAPSSPARALSALPKRARMLSPNRLTAEMLVTAIRSTMMMYSVLAAPDWPFLVDIFFVMAAFLSGSTAHFSQFVCQRIRPA
ncbi:MAG: hypothetical protein GYA21_17660 [Myxococcales bacterium]|nr:hypothetical protein [Myxococcales bacterium]